MRQTEFSFGETAQALKEEVLEQVAENSGSWMDRFKDAARKLADENPGDIVTGESLRLTLEPLVGSPHHQNAWGAAIAGLVRSHIIEQTGRWVPTKDPKSHACRKPEYILVRTSK